MCAVIMERIESDGRRRQCNAKCHNAKHPTCTCICGGRWHGSAPESGGSPVKAEERVDVPPGLHRCPECGAFCTCTAFVDGGCDHCEGRRHVVVNPIDTLPLFAADMT